MTNTYISKLFFILLTMLLALNCYAKNNESLKGTLPLVTVGGDVNCDFQIGVSGSLQDAIMFGADETRLATNTQYNFITANSIPLHLVGGYDNCQDAVDNIIGVNKSIINGIINLETAITAINSQMTLENLILQNGDTGLLSINGVTQLKLKNIIVQNNIGGSGIVIQNFNGALFEDVRITENQSAIGAGLFCSQSSLSIVGESSIDHNHAIGGTGGGIYSNNCDITLVGGSNLSFPAGLSDNTSDTLGGGVYMQNNSQLFITGGNLVIDNVNYGDKSKPFTFYNNETVSPTPSAIRHGGGIYSDNSQIEITNISMVNNHALGNGGAVYAINNSTVNINSTYGDCWSNIACNFIGLNTAEIGGAFLFGDNTVASIKSSQITQNRANIATVVNVGTSSTLNLESSFVFSNGDNGIPPFSDIGMIRVNNASQFNMQHTTVVDNASLANVTQVLGQSDALMVNSILYNPTVGPYIDVISGTNSAQCLFVDPMNNMTSAQVIAISAATYNGAFVNTSNGDYHLTDTTTLIDSCQSPPNSSALDVDGQAIGYDDPMFGAGLIIYDVGADEITDVLFMNGFE